MVDHEVVIDTAAYGQAFPVRMEIRLHPGEDRTRLGLGEKNGLKAMPFWLTPEEAIALGRDLIARGEQARTER